MQNLSIRAMLILTAMAAVLSYSGSATAQAGQAQTGEQMSRVESKPATKGRIKASQSERTDNFCADPDGQIS